MCVYHIHNLEETINFYIIYLYGLFINKAILFFDFC